MEKSLTPRQVAQAIGVSEASLKRWCDKGVLRATRTEGGHRRLALEDVLEFLRRTGRRPVSPEVLSLPSIRGAAVSALDRAADLLLDALVTADEPRVARLIFDLYLARNSICEIGDRVVAPAFRQIGALWECHEAEPYQERRACEICSRVLWQLRASLPPVGEVAPMAIGATLTGDAYRLPSILVELTLRESGWRAEFLGTGLPAASLCPAISRQRPALFWLSVSHVGEIPAFLDEYRPIYAAACGQGVPVVVGGRALEPALRGEMEFTAYCDNLRHLRSLVAGLRKST